MLEIIHAPDDLQGGVIVNTEYQGYNSPSGYKQKKSFNVTMKMNLG